MDARMLSALCAPTKAFFAYGEIVRFPIPDAGIKLRVTKREGDGG